MVRTSFVARRQAGSLKKAIYKKKVEKKQLRYFRRQEPSQHLIAPVAVEMAPLSYTSSTDNTMRSIKSLTESFTPSELTVSCKQSTDRFLAGLFSPSDYQKNIESSSSEEVDHNLGLLFPLSPIPEERTNQVDSDKEVVSFGNLFASEQEKKQPILSKTSDEVICLGHLFSETSGNETSESLGPLFSLPVTSEQEVVTFGNLFESEKELNQSIVSQTSDEVISFSEASDKESTQPLGPLFSTPMISEISETDIVTFGNLFASENERAEPIVTFPESSDESEVFLCISSPKDSLELSCVNLPRSTETDIYSTLSAKISVPVVTLPESSGESDEFLFPNQKDSLELSYVQNLPRLSATDFIYSDLSEEIYIPVFVRERLPESSDLSTTTDEVLSNEAPKNPRHRLTKKMTKEISTKDRVAALEKEVGLLRAEVEELRKRKNNAKTTKTEDVLPVTSAPSSRIKSKSDTVVNAKKTEEMSKRETRTL